MCVGALLVFTACGASAPPPPANFSAEITIARGGSKQYARLEAERPGLLQLVFASPETLGGMEISIKGDAASLEYDGMRAEIPAAFLPREGAAPLLNQVLLQLAQPLQKSERKSLRHLRGGGWERRGAAGGVDYIARLSEEGALQNLRAAGLEIVISYET